MFQRLQKKRAGRRLGDWAKRRMGEGILVEFDQGRIEGPAAKVVYEDCFRATFALPFAMSELDAGGAGFIQYTQYVKPGVTKRLHGKKSLIAIGVGGDPEDNLQCLMITIGVL